MKPGIRHGLLVLTGLAAVLLIIFFTAYGLSTYGSIRGIVGSIASETDQAASLHNQFVSMTTFFAENKGDMFTYRFGSLPVSIDKTEAAGLDETRVLNLMLDLYSSNIYHVKFSTGLMGKISSLFNAEANFTFGILTLIAFAAFIVLGIASLLPHWEGSFSKKLKEEGLAIIGFCAIAFFVFLIAPALIKSIIWGAIPSSDVARNIIRIIESRVVSSLLLDDILIGLLGALVFAIGFFIDRKSPDSTPPAARGKKDSTRRAPQPQQQKGGQQQQQKSKYKGL
jgi:hypothetical protein